MDLWRLIVAGTLACALIAPLTGCDGTIAEAAPASDSDTNELTARPPLRSSEGEAPSATVEPLPLPGLLARGVNPHTVIPNPVIPPARAPVPAISPAVTWRAVERRTLASQQPAVPDPYAESEEAEGGLPESASEEEPPATQPPEDPIVLERHILGEPLVRGTFTKRTWLSGETFYGTTIPTPVLVAHGAEPGPTLCLTAAVHGDELNGIETVRRVMYDLDVTKLSGTVIGVPIVNLEGFQRHSRYLPDRRDLNRFFPGSERGSSASRMAYSFFNEVIRHCNALVDLHTGSFHRTNLPQLRADLNDEGVVRLTQGFGSTVILHSDGGDGTLRSAATRAGIPAVTLEAGEPLRVQESAVDHATKGIFTLMDTMEMYDRRSLWGNPEPVYYVSDWVRADRGGILLAQTKLGRRVKAGDPLGTVTDPITNQQSVIESPYDGRIIGMALNQFVMPGYATFHIGIEAPVETASEIPTEDVGEHSEEDVSEQRDMIVE